MVSRMTYFQRIETARREWIADRREGVATMIAPPSLSITEGSNELLAVNNALAGLFGGQFASVESGGRIEMGGTTFNVGLPFFIYSFSCGELDALTNVMCRQAPVHDRYDACLRIFDPHRLANAIYAGTVVDPDAPFASVFASLSGGEVTYEAQGIDLLSGLHFSAGALRKAPEFADQCEHRYILEPVRPDLPDRIAIKVQQPECLFDLVFKSDASA